MNAPLMTTTPDDQLWLKSRDGDREAFGRIVERYQSLICSLAYSACGNLSRSEDLAQETFVTAWQKLGDLREPSKLRAWLCGIVRNLSANEFRREQRRGGPAESIDAVAEAPTDEADPASRAVSQEEADLLWRALAGMPDNYREPMVLFYREGQSILEVARALELTENTVKQRLLRGRSMLREEMTALVESTLKRTKPGVAFTAAVLVALPAVSASTASAAVITAETIAKGGGGAGTVGKGLLAKLGLGAFVGPVIGLFFTYLGTKAAASTARSERERKVILRYALWHVTVFCVAMSVGLAIVLSQEGKWYTASAAAIVIGVFAWTAALVGGVLWMSRRLEREVQHVRIETHTTDDEYPESLRAEGRRILQARYLESKSQFLGLPIFAIAWGGHGSERPCRRTVIAWIAVGELAISPFLAFGDIALAPIAVGALTVGVLSLSIFWGVAIGVMSLGSLAFGWWAVGCAAGGWKCAIGFAAVAHKYALGLFTGAAEANSAIARNWFRTEWFPDFSNVIVHHARWWIPGLLFFAVLLGWRRRRLAERTPG